MLLNCVTRFSGFSYELPPSGIPYVTPDTPIHEPLARASSFLRPSRSFGGDPMAEVILWRIGDYINAQM